MRALTLALVLVATSACGPGSPGGPTMNNRMGSEAAPAGPSIQSKDILERSPRAGRVMVKHVLVGWDELSGKNTDPRAANRTREEADELATQILEQARAGAPIEALMKEYSEDPGSAGSGTAYEVTPSAGLVESFKRLSLRLDVGESGLVLSDYGWHIIQRTE